MSFRRKRVFLGSILVCFSVYAGVYINLSLRGRYLVTAYTIHGPVSHLWAPAGFEAGEIGEDRIDKVKMTIFAPLYWPDVFLWHTRARVRSGNYPVEEFNLIFSFK